MNNGKFFVGFWTHKKELHPAVGAALMVAGVAAGLMVGGLATLLF